MAPGGGPNPGHGEAADGDDRRGVAGTGGLQRGQLAQQGVVDVAPRQVQVQRQWAALVPRTRHAEHAAKALRELVPATRLDLETGRATVTAVAHQEVRAALERRREVVAGGSPARCAEVIPHRGGDRRRQAEVLGKPPGHEADDPNGPRTTDQDRPAARAALGIDEGAGLVQRRARGIPSRQVRGVERGGARRRLPWFIREKECGGNVRVPDPAGGVEARREGEPDGLERRVGGRDTGRGKERRDRRPGAAANPVEAQARDRPVLAQHRRDIRHGADHREVGEVPRRRLGRDPAQPLQQERRNLEGHAGPGEPRVGVGGVQPVRVDEGERRRRHRRHPVVVRHDHVDPGVPRRHDLGAAGAAHVHGDHEPPPAGARELHRPGRKAVAVLQPAGDMPGRVDPERPQRAHHDRQSGQAVRVEVAHDEDPVAVRACARDPCHDRLRVRQAGRVVEGSRCGAEERFDLVRGDTAGSQDAGQPRGPAMSPDRGEECLVERGQIRIQPAEARLDHGTQDAMPDSSRPLDRRSRRAGEPTPPGTITTRGGGPVGRRRRPGGAPPTPPRG